MQGLNVRDWLHVMDHCSGIDAVIERGTAGEVYNIGGGNEVRNVDLTHMLLRLAERPESLIKEGAGSPGTRPPLQPRHVEASCDWAGSLVSASSRA